MPQILVLAEHEDSQLKRATLSAIGFARRVCGEVGGSFDVLVMGKSVIGVAETLRGYGAATVLIADHVELENPVADKFAHVISAVAMDRSVTMLVGAASTFSKDILPRVAALLDAGMLSDVIEVLPDGCDFIFKRVMYAGNVIATVKLEGPIRVLTIRAAAFAPPEKIPELSPVISVALNADQLPRQIEYVGREAKVAGHPDSTEARIVVSGGRAIKNAEEFQRLIGGLADVLGGAVGSSRALVDAGITPNSLQIGQTGKVVAPDLYIAVGISGAIQHLAGMKDSKIIVAINKDPEAPIFEVADYGLVGDIYQLVPELEEELRRSSSPQSQ